MSTYYEFYAAVEKDGKVEAIGPYVYKDGGYRLTPILSCSRSFIQWDEFGYWDLPIEKMAEDESGKRRQRFLPSSRTMTRF